MLVRNTPWARGFFRKAHQAQQRPAAMAPVLTDDIRLHGERNATLEQVPCSPCRGFLHTSAICRSVQHVLSYRILTPASRCCCSPQAILYLLLSRGKVNQPKVCLHLHDAPAPVAYFAGEYSSFIQANMACAAVVACCTPLVLRLLRNAR